MALVNQTENIPKFQKYWKIPVYYWPYSSLTYNSLGNYDKNVSFSIPVFTGSQLSHQDRSHFLKKLQRKLPIKIIGTKSKDDVRNKTQDFSVSSSCILCFSTRYDWKIKGYCCVRPWQYGGAGGILIIRPHKKQENLIPEKLYYIINTYNDKGIEQVIKHWNDIKKLSDIKKQEKREQIFSFIQKYHSSHIRMKQTLELIQGKRNKLNVTLDEI
jgi:hypothetical protein